ncbi:MAG: NAD(P)/FAD-dependent oxidoreductase [Bacteroidetes bacterium]|nr:NAD(P)/FAD-dependent oxidoreductase [Bacteroidota bacterium]
MEKFDVIIVGGGPAGLICAEKLSKSELKVLLLEKEDAFGDKVCAGGLTRKGLALLDIPDDIIGQKVYKTTVYSRKRHSQAETRDPVVVTIDRRNLGAWQRKQLDNTSVVIRKNARVTEIRKESLIVNESEEIGFRFLVGADGYASLVRRYLAIPLEKKLIGIQYVVPVNNNEQRLEIFLDRKHFHAWYGWIFPHRGKNALGCCCDPRYLSAKKLKENFQHWLKEKDIDISEAEYQSAPINYDYRGLSFGNVFLVGDAAGMASGLTGEGIYQSLVSGLEVAEYILGREEVSDAMKAVIRYNRIQEKMMKIFIRLGWFRGSAHEMIIMLLNNKRFKARVNKGFS